MDCSHAGDDETAFVDWLRISGSTVSPSIAIHSYTEKEMGRGVIALQDIEVRSSPCCLNPLCMDHVSLTRESETGG